MNDRIRIQRIKRANPLPPVWRVIYRHPLHGVLIKLRRDHTDAIAYADRLRMKGEA